MSRTKKEGQREVTDTDLLVELIRLKKELEKLGQKVDLLQEGLAEINSLVRPNTGGIQVA